MSDLVGVLLAAGSARRFGAPKLLHALPDGVPIGVAAARALLAALPDSVAVVRRGDDRLAGVLAAVGLRVVECSVADGGMGDSLADAVRATPQAAGWMIALGDMPRVQAATIGELAARLRSGASLVAPVHAGRRGHPVGFDRRWGKRLAALAGDQGARRLLVAHAAELVLLATEDAGVLIDIDRPDDL